MSLGVWRKVKGVELKRGRDNTVEVMSDYIFIHKKLKMYDAVEVR